MTQAMKNVRVLDLTDSVAGQFCTRLMADHGADVVLVEPPGGSVTRSLPTSGNTNRKGEASSLFWHLNTTKKSITLDWAKPEGFRLLAALCHTADVLMVGRGVARNSLKEGNKGLITCLVSDFGESGPYSNWHGAEIVHQALSGTMFVTGHPDKRPLYGFGRRSYYACGVSAYIAVLAALYHRHVDGQGQDVEVSVFESAAAMGQNFATQFAYNGTYPLRGRYPSPLAVLPCRDGWVVLFALRRWPAVCAAFGAEELRDDPRFATLSERTKNWDQACALLQEKARQISADQLVAEGQKGKASISKVMDPGSLLACRHLEERKFWERVRTEQGQRMALGPVFRMSATPRQELQPAPSAGQHNSGIYAALGVTPSNLAELERIGAI